MLDLNSKPPPNDLTCCVNCSKPHKSIFSDYAKENKPW